MKFAYLMLFVLGSLVFNGCSGCEEEPLPKEDPKPVVKKEDPPKEDPLKAATEDAEKLSTENAVFVSDRAMEVAAEIEAAAKSKKTVRRPPKEQSEPETGKLAKSALRKVFNVHAGAMRKCYERQLKRNPTLEGKVRLEVLIRSNGTVRTAKVSTVSLKNSQVSNCMERQALTMKFPKPDGGAARVSMPYTFTPEI